MDNTGHTVQQALRDEVLRKIGRNVLLFQQIEGLLKFLVVNYKAHGTSSDLMMRQQRRLNKVQKHMMGQLVEQYVDGILTDAGDASQGLDAPSVPWISFSSKITGDHEFYESQCTNLKLMKDERNDLIHHFLLRWQPDSLSHMTDASDYLDKQREKILPILEHLMSVSKSMQEARKSLADFLASDEGQKHFELQWLQSSPLISLLRDISSQVHRPDGWTYLAHAGNLARVHESDAVANMKELYGHSTLKTLLVASELFDVFDEPLPTGRFRTLYRAR